MGAVSRWPRLSRLGALSTRVGLFFVSNETLPDGRPDVQAIRKRHRRVVMPILLASLVTFVPSLAIAGVPTDLWPTYVAGAMGAAAVISWSLVVVPPTSRASLVWAAVDAWVIVGLDWLIGDYYHELVLLFALVVAGQAAIQGSRAALVMVAAGSVLVPAAMTVGLGVNPSDPLYAFIYLVGLVTILWVRDQVEIRGTVALRASEARYRELVERVPAIVYTADVGPEGRWRYVSPHIVELLGFTAEAWTSAPGLWLARIHPDDRERVLAEEAETSADRPGTRSRVEYRLLDHEDRVRWVIDEAAIVVAEDGSRRWSGFLVDVTDRKVLEEQLEHQAFHDELTGLANRALFTDRVDHALALDSRKRDSLAVLFLDLDDFKTVNDGMGHEAGDALLVAVGRVLQDCLRLGDTAARLGGDEFGILLEDQTAVEAAGMVAERILAALTRPIAIRGRDVVIGASIGIAGRTGGRETAAEILRNADSAMYAAKRRGKGRHAIYAPAMHAEAVDRLQLTEEIRRGLAHGEFVLHYQPVVRLSDGAIAGFEALVRWNHPRRGLVMPGSFIPPAEESGQIIEIGRVVLDEACRQARIWRDACVGAIAPTMSVNVSPRQFRDPSICAMVASATAAAGIDPSSLILEITEGIAMEDSDAALDRLLELKALGVRLAIDDFGTGYSSLSYLRRLPIDILKLDKSFVDGIAGGGEALKLARVIVRMGATLHLDTVAEGVEQPAQAEALRRMGCAQAQGFYFAHPMPAADVTALLSRTPDGLLRAG